MTEERMDDIERLQIRVRKLQGKTPEEQRMLVALNELVDEVKKIPDMRTEYYQQGYEAGRAGEVDRQLQERMAARKAAAPMKIVLTEEVPVGLEEDGFGD
jgi:hypothetical protein